MYFQTALQLGLPQWDLTEGAAVRAGRDCMMAAEALPFAAESMDLLLLPHALDDGESCGAVADEAYRVLAAEGRLVLSGSIRIRCGGCFTVSNANRFPAKAAVYRSAF